MQIAVPAKANIKSSSPADPLKFYYIPGVRRFFLKRLELAARIIGNHRFSRGLEIGCGSGIFLKHLSASVDELWAVDIHPYLKSVGTMASQECFPVRLAAASVLTLPFPDETFDLVVCLSVLEHVAKIPQAVQEIRRILSHGGCAVIGFPVENKFVHWGLKLFYHWLPGAKLEEEHVSFYTQIIQQLKCPIN